MKILRKITPLLILMGISIIWAITIFISESDGQGWGLLLAFALIGFAVGFLIIDLLLKRYLKNWKKIMLVESGLVLLLFVWYQYGNRQLTMELPQNFSKKYVSIIYNVENEKELGINSWTWSKNIKVPEDGIILTSSKITEELPKIDFRSFDGESYNKGGNQKMFIKITNSEFEQNGRTYKIRTWRIGEGEFMISTSEEHKEYKTELIKNFEKKAGR